MSVTLIKSDRSPPATILVQQRVLWVLKFLQWETSSEGICECPSKLEFSPRQTHHAQPSGSLSDVLSLPMTIRTHDAPKDHNTGLFANTPENLHSCTWYKSHKRSSTEFMQFIKTTTVWYRLTKTSHSFCWTKSDCHPTWGHRTPWVSICRFEGEQFPVCLPFHPRGDWCLV